MTAFKDANVQQQGGRMLAVEHAKTLQWFRDGAGYLRSMRPPLSQDEAEVWLSSRLLDCPVGVVMILNRSLPPETP